MSSPPYATERGTAHPPGAIVEPDGVNFSVFSESATSIELLLFDEHDDLQPVQVVKLDPLHNRTFHFWHVKVLGLTPGAHYAYRVDGAWDPSGRGHRFNRHKVLIDPYALGNTTALWDRGAACGPEDNLATSMRSVVVDAADYDWEGDRPLRRPMEETVIYEMHVRGFTRSPSSGVEHPGTFAGVVEKIPYLEELGVTAVELMPVFDFDRSEVLRSSPVDGRPLVSYWGYDPFSHVAPHSGYCVNPEIDAHIREFRDMVKALHRAGIEVILDVVFNHTNEGNHQGPTINLKGFENAAYYMLVPQDRQYYLDFSGCGNTLNANHPVVEKFILDCLTFWVREMHVDGFRFDEGSVLSRGTDGVPMPYPPVIWQIELMEELAETKIIAEAWDAAGLYQVGIFPGARWAEWNGRYRDDIRRFVRGDPGLVGPVASRIGGSADIFQSQLELPINSVNFITAHDGFTLNDLVSYNDKHNDANGEGNRDGVNDNMSWNCGAEGETGDPAVEGLRRRQVKNFAAILLLSDGVPMIVMGDEVRRTQLGNNNAYCQDGELTWFDWTLVDRQSDVLRFFREMIAFRTRHPAVHRLAFLTGQMTERGIADVAWHGCRLGEPGWSDPDSHVLAFTLAGTGDEPDLHVMLNMDPADLEFDVPGDRTWRRAIDTALDSPLDIAGPGEQAPVPGPTATVRSHSVVALEADPPPVGAAPGPGAPREEA